MGLFPAGGGFTIDGVGSDTWRMYCQKYTISMMPGLRSSLISVPGRTGKMNAGVEIDSRIVRMSLSCFNTISRASLLANLRAFAAAVDPRLGMHKLVFTDDDPTYFINVIPTTEIPTSPEFVKSDFEIQFEAPDPHWYYITPRSYALTANNAASNVNVDNTNGNDKAAPIFTITRLTAATMSGFSLTYNGSTFTYSGVVGAGDTIVVNTDNYTVTKNGVNDIANWAGDDFPQLGVGAGLVIHWNDPSNVGGNIGITYNERSI